jgi:triosephosphate isomerase
MKKLFIVANWKSYKTSSEVNDWLQKISNFQFPISNEKEIVVCAPFTLLPLLKAYTDEVVLPFKIGSQDVSPFSEGAYTGEVHATQIKEFAEYTIIGHSERRKYFKEDDALLAQKVAMAKEGGLEPIFCVQDEKTAIPDGVSIVAYEPVAAIGSGHPDTPENAEKVAKAIRGNPHVKHVLYGGSVTGDNVHSFTSSPSIDGALVGGASLDPEKFFAIIKNS